MADSQANMADNPANSVSSPANIVADPVVDNTISTAVSPPNIIDNPENIAPNPAVDDPEETVDTPTVDNPVIDISIVDISIVDISAIDTPAVDNPAVDNPAVDNSAVDNSAVFNSAAGSSAVDISVVDIPAVDNVDGTIDNLGVDNPEGTVNSPAVDNPAVDNSVVDNPEGTVDNPADNPAVDNPAVDNSAVDNSAADNSAVDNPEIDNSEGIVDNPESIASVPVIPKITLYWLEQSRSQRIVWLLEELELPYELKIFHRDPTTHYITDDSEIKKIHPLGKCPVISIAIPDSDAEPVIIAESANICEYLIKHFGNGTTLAPTQWKEGQCGQVGGETEEWLRYRYFMHYAEGSLMAFLIVGVVAKRIREASVPFFFKPIIKKVVNKIGGNFLFPAFFMNHQFLEEQLATSPRRGRYLCGKYLTAADIMLSFPLIAGGFRTGLTRSRYPRLFAYTTQLQEKPNYKKAVKKIIEIEGKYEIAF